MTTIYLLYLHDKSVKYTGPGYPDFTFTNPAIYPLLWIGTTNALNLSNVIYDKRSTYNKCKNQKRYFMEYMELFKYLEAHNYNTELSIEIKCLETSLPTTEIVNERMAHNLLIYRTFYGSHLLLNKDYREFLIEGLKRFEKMVPDRLALDPSVSVEERKKISAKKYTETHREKLNAKSRRYYQRNKELIKEKRLAKIAEISNTAQPNSEIST